jgi:hypothetical protein
MVNGTRTHHNLLCASLRVSLFTTIHPLVDSTLHLGLLNFKTKHVIIISRNIETQQRALVSFLVEIMRQK